jgi:peptidyl-prolyl cis-trans isomerase SurA
MKIKIFLLVVLTTITISAQQVLDKIVAVVDNEIILQSELDFQIGIYASQRQVDINTPGLKEQILNSMIEKLLCSADLDSITVSEDEINKE